MLYNTHSRNATQLEIAMKKVALILAMFGCYYPYYQPCNPYHHNGGFRVNIYNEYPSWGAFPVHDPLWTVTPYPVVPPVR